MDGAKICRRRRDCVLGMQSGISPSHLQLPVPAPPRLPTPALHSCGECLQGSGTSPHDPFLASVRCVRELHKEGSDRSCLHVELDTSGSGMDYEAGDHVGIYTQNDEKHVREAAELLGLPLDTTFSLSLPDGNPQELSLPFQGEP